MLAASKNLEAAAIARILPGDTDRYDQIAGRCFYCVMNLIGLGVAYGDSHSVASFRVMIIYSTIYVVNTQLYMLYYR